MNDDARKIVDDYCNGTNAIRLLMVIGKNITTKFIGVKIK